VTKQELKDKAHSLPLSPGVYIMMDKAGTVIYVGKSRALKNRVSQYFADLASHTSKTRAMVSQIDHFDYILADSEFEALVLENSLIKRHKPRYNILLKDDKGYPFVRLSREAYVEKCQEIDPASFYRTPDAYRGEFVKMELTVVGKVVDAEAYYGNEKYTAYYIARSADGSITVLLRDCNREGTLNLMTGDSVTVYGEGEGNVEFYGLDGNVYSGSCLNVAFWSVGGVNV
jgi:hypothetical protein